MKMVYSLYLFSCVYVCAYVSVFKLNSLCACGMNSVFEFTSLCCVPCVCMMWTEQFVLVRTVCGLSIVHGLNSVRV